MIVDTSAVIAMLVGEAGADRVEATLVAAPTRRMSAGSLLEAKVVVHRRSEPRLDRRLDDLVTAAGIEIVPVSAAQAAAGASAYRDYGKGSGHPAQLNFGDCFAYALARETGEPLLFVGDDFTHTDLRSAL